MRVKKILHVYFWAWTIFAALSVILGCDKHNSGIASSSYDDKKPKTNPNFITLVIDDMGWSDCGFMGSEIPTPNIDQMANNGIIFTNFYGASTSSPSRSMLFTGKDNHQVGAGTMCGFILPETEGKPGYECNLEFYAPTFAEVLQDAGYHTMFTGKWHLGEDSRHIPEARGFKDARGVALEGYEQFFANDDGSNIPMAPPVLYKKFNRTSFWNENGKEVKRLPKDFYATNYIMDKAIEMLKDRPKNKPFYLNISFTAVHFPIQAPENVIQKYIPTYIKGWDIIRKERFERQKELGFFPYDYILPQRDDVPRWDSLNEQEKQVAFSLLVPIEAKKMAVYAAMLDIVDQNIGRLISYLKENGEYENTVFFFMSDNGASDRDPAVDKHYHMVEWIQAKFDNSLKSIGSKHSFTGLSKGWAMAANTPFNRYKATMYEGGVHTVAFAYYPKLNVSGKRSNCVTSIMDIAPTILDLAGVKYPETYKGKPLTPMQGVSFASLIKDPSDTVGCDKNRYIGWEFVGIKGLRQGNWKLSQEAFDNEFNMFNLSKDPFEEVDLSQKMPERFQQMKNAYKQYREENGVIDVPNSGGGGG